MTKIKHSLSLVLALICLHSFAQVSPWQWAAGAGGTNVEESYGIAVDASGNYYVTGYFLSPTVSFSGTMLTNAEPSETTGDLFVAKYNVLGGLEWAVKAGDIGYEIGTGIALDPAGNPYITGTFTSTSLTLGSTTLTNAGGKDRFIAKLDIATGAFVAAYKIGDTGDETGKGIAVDALGNIFVSGTFNSPTLTIGSTVLTTNASEDVFVAKYSASGTPLWAKSAGGNGGDYAFGIAIGLDGNISITGYFSSDNITFGTTTLTGTGVYDIFTAHFDTDGTPMWAKSAAGSGDDQGLALDIDVNGNTLITGLYTSTTLSFDGTTIANAGNKDVFIAKYDDVGNLVWAKSMGGSADEEGRAIITNGNGGSYITGYFESSALNVGTSTLNNAGMYDLFVARYDDSGSPNWSAKAGKTGNDYGYSLALDATETVYLTGTFNSSTIAFGSTTLTSQNNFDAYTATLMACYTTIGGHIKDNNLPPTLSATDTLQVILIKKTFADSTLWVNSDTFNIVQGNDSAKFWFDSLYANAYILVAKFIHPVANQNYIPTFSGDTHLWALADTVITSNCDSAEIDINILNPALTPGTNSLSGYLYFTNFVVEKTQTNNDPIPLIDVVIEKDSVAQQFVPYTSTPADSVAGFDNFLYYHFNGLADGNYKIKVTIPGIGQPSTYNVTVSDSTQMAGLNFCVDTALIGSIEACGLDSVEVPQGIESITENRVYIYPNPNAGILNVIGLPEGLTISLYDATGRKVWEGKVANEIIQLSGLENGIYYLCAKATDGVLNRKIIVAK